MRVVYREDIPKLLDDISNKCGFDSKTKERVLDEIMGRYLMLTLQDKQRVFQVICREDKKQKLIKDDYEKIFEQYTGKTKRREKRQRGTKEEQRKKTEVIKEKVSEYLEHTVEDMIEEIKKGAYHGPYTLDELNYFLEAREKNFILNIPTIKMKKEKQTKENKITNGKDRNTKGSDEENEMVDSDTDESDNDSDSESENDSNNDNEVYIERLVAKKIEKLRSFSKRRGITMNSMKDFGIKCEKVFRSLPKPRTIGQLINKKETEITKEEEEWIKLSVDLDDVIDETNYNTDLPLGEMIKIKKEKQKEMQKQLRLFNEWRKNKIVIPPPMRVHNLLHCSDELKGKKRIEKMYDIRVENFNLSIYKNSLLTDTVLKINTNRKYGLIGRNGIGKSTLLGKLARYEVEEIKKDISIACIEQELHLEDVTVLESVLMVDKMRHDLLKELEELEHMKQIHDEEENKESNIDEQILKIYEMLHNISYLETEKEASKILCGLGFDSNLQKKKVSSLSGGMRMRLCLSRILFSNNDLILLDEPTNHLDIYSIQFLIDYINQLDKTCIIVSHDRDFLNEVCTDIIHFHNQKLTYYSGNYDQFEKTRMEHLLQQQREFNAVEMKKKHMQKFIDRFRCNSKRAALVQSRIKLLNKLPVVNLDKDEALYRFTFLEPFYITDVLIRITNLSFRTECFKDLKIQKKKHIIIEDYEEDDEVSRGDLVLNLNEEQQKDEIENKTEEYKFQHEYLFKNASFTVDMDSRIAICGVNGSGKTTLIKIILHMINTYEGELFVSNKAKIGYYSQYHVDSLNPVFNSIQQLKYTYSDMDIKEEEAISYFNKFDIPTQLLYEPTYVLSGGQKSKLALAILAFNNPNILILDEPTNHLDIESVQALIVALNLFKGGVILVSHDTYLIKHVADEVYHINNFTREIIKINEEFDTYTKKILQGEI